MIEIREIDQPIPLPAPYGQMYDSCLQRLLDAYGPEDVQELCWFLIVEPSNTPADLGRCLDPVWEWKDEYPDHIESILQIPAKPYEHWIFADSRRHPIPRESPGQNIISGSFCRCRI